METKKTVTVNELLEITINNLNAIQVPMGLMQSIGYPLAGNIENLKKCLAALNQPPQEQPQEEPPMEDVDLGEIDLTESEEEENA